MNEFKQLISDVIDNVSLKTADGMVDFNDAYHVYLVQEELKKVLGEEDAALFLEKDKDEISDKDKEAMAKQGLSSIPNTDPIAYGKAKEKNDDGTPKGNTGEPPAVYVYNKDKKKLEKADSDKDSDSAQTIIPQDPSAADQQPPDQNQDYDPANKTWKPEGGHQEKALKRATDKLRGILGQIAVNEDEEQSIVRVIDSIENGTEPDQNDLEIFNKFIRIKETSGQSKPEFAFYIANSVPGDFKQGRRAKVELGASQNAHMVRRFFEALGMKAASASTTAGKVPPKLSGKIMTMTKIAGNKGGGIQTHTVEKTRGEDGKLSEVKIGKNRVLKRIPVPDNETLMNELVDRFVEIKDENPGISDKDAKRKAKKKLATINRNNAMLDQYENIDEVQEARLVKGADSSTPEGRAKIAKEGPIVMADSIQEHMEKVGPLTRDEKEMLDRMRSLGNIKDPAAYEKEAMALLADMQKIESMRKGVPDVAEAIIMCCMNKKGLDTIAPAGETYKVADLIVYPPVDDPENPNSAEYIVWLESSGGLSVKWKGGAASGARAKIEVSAFNNSETQGRLTNILDLHNNFMGTSKQPLSQKRIDSGKAELDKQEAWARKNGHLKDDDFDKNGDLIIPGAKNNRTTKQWAADSIADWQNKGKLPVDCTPTLKASGEPCLTKENKKLLLDSLDQYCRGGVMLSKIHNSDLDYQPYGNANGTADALELSNGIDCVNHMHFQPNPGFDFTEDKDGNYIVRPNAVYAGHLDKVCD